MPNDLHHIIYLSRATMPLVSLELLLLLIPARTFNERHRITGSLVYGNGQFMQVLEGERAVVTALYERIVADGRHTSILKLADKPITARSFAEWSMAFRDLSHEQAELAGFIPPAHWEHLARQTASVDAALLGRMRQLMLATGGRY